MSKLSFKFHFYEDNEHLKEIMINCDKEEYLNDLINKFCSKNKTNKINLIFHYRGTKLCFEKNFKIRDKFEKIKSNESINILVFSLIKKNKFKIRKEIQKEIIFSNSDKILKNKSFGIQKVVHNDIIYLNYDNTFDKLQELQLLIRKEFLLKELCKKLIK